LNIFEGIPGIIIIEKFDNKGKVYTFGYKMNIE